MRDIGLQLTVNQLGQVMQGRLMVVKLGALAPDHGYTLPKKARTLPVKLPAQVRKDSVTLKLPAGFVTDEVPDPIQLESPYGVYRASWKASGDRVVFEQSIEVKDALVPAREYRQVREFFERVSGGQYSAVVLVKQ